MKYVVSLGVGEEQVFAINTAMSQKLKVIAFDMNKCDYSIVKPDLFYNISIHEKEKIADILSQFDICCILPSPVGRNVTTVGYLNDYFKLKGPSFLCCDICSDKLKNNKYLEENGLPFPQIYDINNVVFPALLKPQFGSGSKFVQIVYNRNEFDEVYNKYSGEYGEYLIQEYIQGVEYGCDLIIVDGEIHFLNIRSKHMTQEPYRQELSYIMPANISDKEYNIIYNALYIYINNMDIDIAVFNADIILSNDMAYIIDISPRAAGLNITSKLITSSYGFNIYEYYINQICGKPNQLISKTNTYTLLQYIPFENILVDKDIDISYIQKKYQIIHIEYNILKGEFMGEITNAEHALKRGFYIIESQSYEELHKRNNDILSELVEGIANE